MKHVPELKILLIILALNNSAFQALSVYYNGAISGNSQYQSLSFNTTSGYKVLNIQFKPNTISLSKLLAVVSFEPIASSLNLSTISQYISQSNSILDYMDPISAIAGDWQFINIAIPNVTRPFFISIFNFDLPQLVSDKSYSIILNYLAFGKICKPCAFGSSLLTTGSENSLRCRCSPCRPSYYGNDCKYLITQLIQGQSMSRDIHQSQPIFFRIENQGYDVVLTLKEITSTNAITMYVQYESEIGSIAGKLNNFYEKNSPLRMLITPQKVSRVINHKDNNILLTFQNTANSLSSFSINFEYRNNKDQVVFGRLFLVIGLSFLGAIFILLICCKIYRTIKLRSIVINSQTSSSKQNRRSFTQDQIQRLFPQVTAESVYEEISISRKDQSQLIQCPICFDTINKNQLIRITQCRHSFHSRCLIQWLKSSSVSLQFIQKCPQCQYILEIQQISESKTQYEKSQMPNEQYHRKIDQNQQKRKFQKMGITLLEEKQIILLGESRVNSHLKIEELSRNDDQITQL